MRTYDWKERAADIEAGERRVRRMLGDHLGAVTLTVLSIFGVAAIFELVEWQYAAWSDPAAGAAFLGSQGDVWDAQKDMLSDGLGAIVFSFLYCLRRRPALPSNP